MKIINKKRGNLTLRFTGRKDNIGDDWAYKDITLREFESVTDDVCYCAATYQGGTEKIRNVLKIEIL
ncbi:hypothetical protein [Rivularia sp. UHCC 0363]|uniref:hypothetical protein n=1 Tax=Rivularia sp. UHCC 0363 TaxID=3110244 RepID=UPI002B210915|nr:hypothetical protein [Rivularia sp. UHCC 0363]MEA5598614.1 hypothetical protein [Rivularia sp. UHCC 0363]